MRRFIFHIVIFLAAFFVVQVACNNLLLKNHTFPYRHNKLFATKYENYLAKKDLYNTVFIGSSRMYRHLSPQIIDRELEEFSIKSYNLGAPGTFMPETFYLLDMILDSQRIDTSLLYVFMELNQVSFILPDNWFVPQSYYYLDMQMLGLIAQTLFTSPGMPKLKAALYSYPYIQGFVVKNIIPQILVDYQPEDARFTGENRDGYYPLDLDLQQSQTERLNDRHAKFLQDTTVLLKRRMQQLERPIVGKSEVYINYLNHLINRAEQLNIKLFFVIPPKLKYYKSLLDYKDSVLDHHVIDTESYEAYPELNLSRYNYDKGHFNHMGAELYSSFVAQRIRERLSEGSDTMPMIPIEKPEPGH